MRVSVAASMVLAAAVMLLASGCVTARPLPDGPDTGDPEVVLQTRLDQAWRNTGLDGDPPEVELGAVVDRESGFGLVSECMNSRGFGDYGYSDGPTGPQLTQVGTTRLSDDMQRSFFTCFARWPTLIEASSPLFTVSQLDYLYDYYREQVIPCLATTGARVTNVPTREEFQGDQYGSWNPYQSTIDGEGLVPYSAAVQRCGDPHAGISNDPANVTSLRLD